MVSFCREGFEDKTLVYAGPLALAMLIATLSLWFIFLTDSK